MLDIRTQKTDDTDMQEQAVDKFRYVMWGTLDEPERVPPRGEFFCSKRAEWMPEIQGQWGYPLLERNGAVGNAGAHS